MKKKPPLFLFTMGFKNFLFRHENESLTVYIKLRLV